MNSAIPFNRLSSLQQLDHVAQWDMVVIGGGATGLGTAVDASSRGYKTLLLEQADFAKGTSSRSTKLVHGGVRYLAQGDIRLVYDALHERGILLRNASHLVKAQPFIIPCFTRFAVLKYLVGLTLYDWLSGRFSFGKSGFLSKRQVTALLPHINQKGLKGGVRYYDGQFDDSRLAINLAQTCAEQGGVLLNYMQVTSLLKESGRVSGVVAIDGESGRSYTIQAKAVVNATGVFVDEILQMDIPGKKPLVRPSQGVHLVFDQEVLKSESALMIPETRDGRVLFAVPWHQHVLVGTTDTPLDEHSLEPRALDKEVKFILETLQQYLPQAPQHKDVLSVFAGLRPLAAPKDNSSSTKEISRDHKLMVSPSGLITITGGKWTTYRKMAEDTVNKAISTAALSPAECRTVHLPVHGSIDANESAKESDGISVKTTAETGSKADRLSVRTLANTANTKDIISAKKIADAPNSKGASVKLVANATGSSANDPLAIYGTDATHIRALMEQNYAWSRQLTDRLPYTAAEVIWAVRHEMARTLEDVLARRLRALFLDARAAMAMAPAVADLMAAEMHRDERWKQEQLAAFSKLAAQYLLPNVEMDNGYQHPQLSSIMPVI